MATEEIRVEYMPLGGLARANRNAKRHRLDELEGSMRRFGYTAPVLLNEGTGRLVFGHGRLDTLEARKAAGHAPPARVVDRGDDWYVPVLRGVSFRDEREAEAYILADNRLVEIGGYDVDMLAEMAKDVAEAPDGLEGTGWTAADIADLAAAEAAFEAEAKQAASEAEEAAAGEESNGGPSDDETPAPDPTDALREKWGTAQGQLWELVSADGQRVHRILCGDCRKPDDVARLLDGRKINVAFTSPPYASQRKYDEESGFKPIKPDEYVDWFEPVQANVRSHLAADGSWFVNIKEHCEDGERSLYVKDLVVTHARTWGWTWIEEYCWRRPSFPGDPLSMRRFKNGWESVYGYARGDFKFRPRAVMHESNGAFSYADQKSAGKDMSSVAQGVGGNVQSPVGHHDGLAYPDNVLDIMEGARVVGHSAAFPVKLPSFFVSAYSDMGDIIFDPFLGSGTTLLAADQHGRIGYGCELSPKYVAGALERAASKGLTPRLVVDQSAAAA